MILELIDVAHYSLQHFGICKGTEYKWMKTVEAAYGRVFRKRTATWFASFPVIYLVEREIRLAGFGKKGRSEGGSKKKIVEEVEEEALDRKRGNAANIADG